MTRQAAFLVLLLFSTVYALGRGGRPEKFGAAAMMIAALLSVLAVRPRGLRFQQVETGVLVIDTLLMLFFVWLSAKSTRFWPIWVSALLGAEVTVHIASMIAPAFVPAAYMNANAPWSWLAQTVLVIATKRHRLRLNSLGADEPWKA